MMSRTQITLESEMQRRARERAGQLGISFAEYVRRLVTRDLGEPEQRADPSAVFDLGCTSGADVARDKDAMLAAAADADQRRRAARG